jgi:hypothetical protein
VARGRLISKSLGSSRKFHALLGAGGKLGEFCQVLFPLLVANTDDFGRMPADAFTVKNVVLPSSPRPERDFDKALDVIATVGLIARYEVEGSIYLQVHQFDLHQPNLHKRTASRFPDGPGTSGNFRTNLREQNLTEPRTQNLEPGTAPPARREADALFEQFWTAYPKKKAKDDALKAWEKRRPTSELLSVMLSALQRQKVSPDWLKDSGRFIPFPATWLNQARWTDEVEVDVTPGAMVTANKRIAGLLAGGEAFLKRRQPA